MVKDHSCASLLLTIRESKRVYAEIGLDILYYIVNTNANIDRQTHVETFAQTVRGRVSTQLIGHT